MLAAPKPHLMPIPCPYTRMWDVRVCSLRSLEHALVTTSQPRVDISHLSPECHHARTWRPVLSYVYMDIYIHISYRFLCTVSPNYLRERDATYCAFNRDYFYLQSCFYLAIDLSCLFCSCPPRFFMPVLSYIYIYIHIL